MTDIEIAEAEHTRLLVRAAKLSAKASYRIKLVSVTAIAAATLAQFEPFELSFWSTVGTVGALVALACAILLLGFEQEAGEAIATAQSNLDVARNKLRLVSHLEAQAVQLQERDVNWASHFTAIQVMRNVLETAAANPIIDVVPIFQHMFETAGYPLIKAAGLEMNHQFTLTIYRAEELSPGRIVLVPIAQDRAEKCHISESRQWPSGVGIAGRCFAEDCEIAKRDIWEGESRGEGPMDRENDRSRYVSLFATPIRVQGKASSPWGVVCASTNIAGHFHKEDHESSDWAGPIRSLRAFVELGIVIAELNKAAQKPLVG